MKLYRQTYTDERTHGNDKNVNNISVCTLLSFISSPASSSCLCEPDKQEMRKWKEMGIQLEDQHFLYALQQRHRASDWLNRWSIILFSVIYAITMSK